MPIHVVILNRFTRFEAEIVHEFNVTIRTGSESFEEQFADIAREAETDFGEHVEVLFSC